MSPRPSFEPAALLALSALAVAFMPGNRAAADDAAPEPIELPPTVITATRLPLPASEVASSVTVVGADDIARDQDRTLPDLLQYVPGLNVVQAGGVGQVTGVYIRGSNPNQVKVLLDGIDISDPSSSDGAFDFAHLQTADIDRVEILRGPQSGLYGGDAIGGVINIVTRKGSGPPRLTGSIEGGSFATFNQSAGLSGSTDRFDYAFDVAHLHSGDTAVTPPELIPAGRSLEGDSYDNVTASAKLGAVATDNLDFGLVARYVSTELHFTQDDLFGPESLQSDAGTREFFTRGTAHLVLFGGRLDQTLGIAYTDYRRTYLDPNPATLVFGNDPSDYHGDRIALDWQGNIEIVKGQTLTLGAEHRLDRIDATTPVTAQLTNDAGYIQLQSSFGRRFFDTVSLRYDDNGQFGGKATYRIAPTFLIPETGTKLKASVGTGFNPPALAELYANFPEFGFFANPNLKPETSFGYEFGFEQELFASRLAFGATYFHNDIDNLIELNDSATTVINIGKASTYGVETFVSYKVSHTVVLRADDTYTVAQDDILHQELLRRPRNKASLRATWQPDEQASFSASLLYTGPWFDDTRSGSASGIPVNGYVLTNLDASRELGHGITAFGRIDNLFDRRYQEPLGFRHPGIGVFAGLRFALDAAQMGG